VVLASARFTQAYARQHGKSLERMARITGWGHRNAGLRLRDKIERSQGHAKDDRVPSVRLAVLNG
jgi:acetyl-CoA C-acetyltransferase